MEVSFATEDPGDAIISNFSSVKQKQKQKQKPKPKQKQKQKQKLNAFPPPHILLSLPIYDLRKFKEEADQYLELEMDEGLSPVSLRDEDFKQAMEKVEDMKEGYRLIQVFSVQFVDYNPADMYGLLLLYHGWSHVLFERFPGDPLPIDSDGFLKLTDPADEMDAYGYIEFYSYLSELKGCAERSCSNLWDGRSDTCLVLCNKLLSKSSVTHFGQIKINFAIFTPSTGAVLEVNFLDWKGNGDEIRVFGEITAHTKLITDDRAKTFMFKREKKMCAVVRPGEGLPLSRSYMVLPVRSGIVLDLHLYHSTDNDSTSWEADDLILNQSFEVSDIGKNGELLEVLSERVQLKITWGMSSIPKNEGVPFTNSLSSTSNQHCQPPERKNRRFAEVFSVRFCDEFYVTNRELYGFALIESRGDDRNAVLFRRNSQDPPFLQKTGFVELNGLMHGVEVKEELVINSYLWTKHPPVFNNKCAYTLWRACDDKTDHLICKEVETKFGHLEVMFAVYSDSLEAHIEVALLDWNAPDGVKVFGIVDASNSRIPGGSATSKLFDRSRDEAVSVKPGKDATNLPLSRSVRVVPRESTFFVDVMISRLEGIHEQKIAEKLCFDANTGTHTEVAYADYGNVQVTVTFCQS